MFREGLLVRAALLVAALSVGPTPVAGEAPPRPSTFDLEGWRALSDGRLTIVTQGDPAEAGALIDSLGSLRRALESLGLGEARAGRLPTTLVLFSAPGGYEDFRQHHRSGQFLPASFENLILVDAGDPARPARMIASHEYVHGLLREGGIAAPLWLNEGLAEYYSTARREAGRIVLGDPPPHHRKRLRGRAFLPLDRLLEMEPTATEYRDEELAARFYAQSWLLTHYLLSDPARARELARFLERIGSGAGARQAVRSAFGLDLESLEGELRRYLNRPRLPGVSLPSAAAPELAAAERSMSPAQAAVLLGVLAIEQFRWGGVAERLKSAAALLDAASALAPTDGDALAARAYLAEVGGADADAAELYRRALYLDPQSARSWGWYARFLIGGGEAWSRSSGAEAARLVLDRALEMAPGHRVLRALEADLGAW